jgi:hypothetical protein
LKEGSILKLLHIIGARPQFIKAVAHPPLYGDGKAAEHCLKALLES